MRKLICLFLFFLVSSVHAQYSFSNFKDIHFKDFFKTTLFYVRIGVSEIDKTVEKSLEKHWDLTPFKCVDEKDFNDARTTHFSKLGFYSYGTQDMISPNFAVFMPNYFRTSAGSSLRNVIAAVPIDCGETRRLGAMGSECGFSELGYRIEIMILQLKEVINFISETEFTGGGKAHFGIDEYIRFYNDSFKGEVTRKKLLINEEIFSYSFTKDDFASLAQFEYKVVDDEDYRIYLNSRNTSYLYLITAHNPMLVASVFDSESKKTLFVQMNYKYGPWLNSKKRASFGRKFVKNLNTNFSKIKFKG